MLDLGGLTESVGSRYYSRMDRLCSSAAQSVAFDGTAYGLVHLGGCVVVVFDDLRDVGMG